MSFVLRLLVVAAFAAVVQIAVGGQPAGHVPAAQFDLAEVGAGATPGITSVASGAIVAPVTDEPVSAAPAPTAPTATAGSAARPAPTTTAGPAPAAPAAPVAVVNPVASLASGASVEERRGSEALALVPFPVERTGYELIFEGHRDGYLGLTSTVNKTITIYIRSSQSTREIAKVIAHEIGHAVDVEFTTETERSLYRQIRGIDSRAWYPDCSGCTDYDSPAGDFAETFAVAMVGDVNFLSTVATPPSATQLQALATIFTV